MKKYIKVMFDNKGVDYEYKIDELNIATVWNPEGTSGESFGGFNFSTEDKIIRWIHRGDTIYDVIVPKEATLIDIESTATPHGVFRSNMIIPTNPRKVTDEIALDFYRKSDIPQNAYYKALAAVSVMGYEKTAKEMLKDKINVSNIDYALEEWNDFIHGKNKHKRENCNDLVYVIEKELLDIYNKK